MPKGERRILTAEEGVGMSPQQLIAGLQARLQVLGQFAGGYEARAIGLQETLGALLTPIKAIRREFEKIGEGPQYQGDMADPVTGSVELDFALNMLFAEIDVRTQVPAPVIPGEEGDETPPADDGPAEVGRDANGAAGDPKPAGE